MSSAASRCECEWGDRDPLTCQAAGRCLSESAAQDHADGWAKRELDRAKVETAKPVSSLLPRQRLASSAAKIVPPERDPRTGEPLTTGTPSAAQGHNPQLS